MIYGRTDSYSLIFQKITKPFFIILHLAKRIYLLTFHASSKLAKAFLNDSGQFYEANFYKGPAPNNEVVTRINFTSLVSIFKFVKAEAFYLDSQNYCHFKTLQGRSTPVV